ncbi:MAG TPA: DUF423 domain-containing protein [Opitutaceae bacterium]|nr:DUF423 domain-containing protein [Opitutaceae bacterium]
MASSFGRSTAFASAAGALAVVSGALGAHKLRSFLEARGHLGAWETAVHYHLVHAVVLLALALFLRRETDPLVARRLGRAAALLAAGMCLFSGSIYALSLGAPRWLGPITPLGGLCLLAGWLAVGFAFRPRRA